MAHNNCHVFAIEIIKAKESFWKNLSQLGMIFLTATFLLRLSGIAIKQMHLEALLANRFR